MNPIWIRTAAEGDVERLADYFERLSNRARYNRFMGAVDDLTRIARDCLMPARKADTLHPCRRMARAGA
jgi:hypothetical protein